MSIVILHDDSVLGKQIIEAWSKKYNQSGGLYTVDNGAVDDLDDLAKYRPRLVVLASDMPSEFEEMGLAKCRDLKLTTLTVLGRGATVLIGPLETPGIPGCATCLQLRWENTFDRSLLSFFSMQGFLEPMPLQLSQPDLLILADIVIEEMQSILFESSTSPNLTGRVGVYEEAERVEWVPLVPSHDCPRCKLVPDDSPDLAQIHFTSHSMNDAQSLRVGSINFQRLEELFFHTKVGYISALNEFSDGDRYFHAEASIYTPAGNEIVGYGAGVSITDAKQSAVLEVLERSCGFQAVNRRPVVLGKYSEIEGTAVHPSAFGLHSYELLESFKNVLAPFDEEKKYSWVWAYSSKHHRPVLIPEQIAYYGPTTDGTRFVTETSNGCAIGATVEEAILHAIFEVLERDGFLNMWYAKLPVPELRLGSHCPSEIFALLSLVDEAGFEVRLFNLSHDLDIPAICAVAINRENDYPKVVSGTACHLNPYEAVSGALRELTVQVFSLLGAPQEKREEATAMFFDSKKVKKILDHVAVASLPEAYPRWEFLLKRKSRPQLQSIEEAFTDATRRHQIDSGDIRLILSDLLDDLHGRGFDIIVVHQTSVEVSYGGLHAVKVVIPGMIPMTFGYGFQRVRGLSRLFELPQQLGYASRILTESDLNQDCHPFS